MPRPKSVVREAYGLPPHGGLVVVPDEFCGMADRFGLTAAERLTLIALLRGWNPRELKAPSARASLEDVSAWTGLSKSQQSAVLKELLTAWEPPLLLVVLEGSRGVPTTYDLRPLVRACGAPRSVRPAERIPVAMRSGDRTKGRRFVRATERDGSGVRTHSSVESPQTLETKTDVARPLASVPDAQLKVWRFLPSEDQRHAAAWTEWTHRMRERRNGTAVGKGKDA